MDLKFVSYSGIMVFQEYIEIISEGWDQKNYLSNKNQVTAPINEQTNQFAK